MNKLNIVRFDDDNHAQRIWANGIYIGTTSDIAYLFENLLNIFNNRYAEKEYFTGINDIEIYIFDDFYELDDEESEILCDFFYTAEKFTEEQQKYIHVKDWKNLLKVI